MSDITQVRINERAKGLIKDIEGHIAMTQSGNYSPKHLKESLDSLVNCYTRLSQEVKDNGLKHGLLLAQCQIMLAGLEADATTASKQSASQIEVDPLAWLAKVSEGWLSPLDVEINIAVNIKGVVGRR